MDGEMEQKGSRRKEMKRMLLGALLLICLMTLTSCGRPPKEVDCIITISQGRMRIIRMADICTD